MKTLQNGPVTLAGFDFREDLYRVTAETLVIS